MEALSVMDGVLTLKDGKNTILENHPAKLTIDHPTDQGWAFPWHLDNVQLPISLQEGLDISNRDMEDPDGWLDAVFVGGGSKRTYSGKVFVSKIAYDGVVVDLRGAHEVNN